MMEQTNAGKAHYHTILVAGIDNIVITNRSTWLSDILNARLMGTLDVVTEGEECIGAKAYIGILIQPCSLLFTGEDLRFYSEESLPCTIFQNIHVILTDIEIDCVITIRTTNIITERKI